MLSLYTPRCASLSSILRELFPSATLMPLNRASGRQNRAMNSIVGIYPEKYATPMPTPMTNSEISAVMKYFTLAFLLSSSAERVLILSV